DECLKSIASVLQRSLLRSSDMATRYGGEEFCLLLPNTSLDGAFNVAQRIRSAIVKLDIPHRTSSVSDTVTLSDGIACFIPSSHDNPSRLVTLADEALYEAKALGRNQSVKGL
ncbi:MAG: diguanylate cyclase, partial [Porticoccus sp.]